MKEESTSKSGELYPQADAPLANALWSLGSDPGMRELRKRIWRVLWARSSFNDWFEQANDDFFIAKVMPRTLSSASIDALEEIKRVAHDRRSLSAALISSVAEHKLASLHTKRDATRQRGEVTEKLQSHITSPIWTSREKQNYSGYICAEITSFSTPAATNDELFAPRTPIPFGKNFRLALWFAPVPRAGTWSEDLLIETGVDEDILSTFALEVDCATLRFPFGRKRVSPFHRREPSTPVYFAFATDSEPDLHQVFVKIFQGQRYIKSFVFQLQVAPQKRNRHAPKKCPPKKASKKTPRERRHLQSK